MSFPTMTFNDLRYTHSKQIYNNSSADKNEDYGEFFNMLSNIMDYTKFFNEIPGKENGYIEYFTPFLKLIKKEKELFNNN